MLFFKINTLLVCVKPEINDCPISTDLLIGMICIQLHPGYQIVFDNINVHQKRRHKTSTNKNVQHNLVQLYAVLDRVNCEYLPDDKPILSDVKALGRDAWWLPADEQQLIKDEINVRYTYIRLFICIWWLAVNFCGIVLSLLYYIDRYLIKVMLLQWCSLRDHCDLFNDQHNG